MVDNQSAAGGENSASNMPNVVGQNIPNIRSVTQNPDGNSIGQGIPSNVVSADSQGQMPGGRQQQLTSSQLLYHKLLQQQHMLNQMLQQQNMRHSLMQSHIQKQQQQQQQQIQIFQPSVMRSTSLSNFHQNHRFPVQQGNQPVYQQYSQSVMRQPPILHQQQTSMSQQQIRSAPQQEQNTANIPQSQLVCQSNSIPDLRQQQNHISKLRQQQLIVHQNNLSNMHQSQQGGQSSVHKLQHTMQPNLVPNQTQPIQQQMMSQTQPHNRRLQHFQQQSNSMQRDIQQGLQNSGALLQQKNEIEQLKQLFQSQRGMPEGSSTQKGNGSGEDYQEEVYQKIKAMKEMYFTEVNEIYFNVVATLQQHESPSQQTKNEKLEKLKLYEVQLEFLLQFLRLNKNDIQIFHKDKLSFYETEIVKLLNSRRSHKTLSSEKGLHPHPHMQQQPQAQSQIPQKQQNNLSGMQHSSLSYVPTVSNSQKILQSQKLKLQIQQRHMQHQFLQDEQQPAQLPVHHMFPLHQIADSSDMKMRQQMGVKPGVFEQHHSNAQCATFHHQQLKPGPPDCMASPQVLQAAAPQVSQHNYPKIYQQNLLCSITKTGKPLRSPNSPFIMPSPSTPIAPSPLPEESEKVNSGISSLSNVGNIGHDQTSAVSGPAQSLSIGTPEISSGSSLLEEFTGPDAAHENASSFLSSKLNAVEQQPFERLIKAVKCVSREALIASVSDISSVVSMFDRIAGTKTMRRSKSAVPSNVVPRINESGRLLNGSVVNEMESTATSSTKKLRIDKTNHALLEEIHEINSRLIDSAVDVCNEDVDPTAEGGEGTIVKCSFNAMSLSPNLKSPSASALMSSIQPLRLLIPTNYPNCCPIILDEFPIEVSKEYEDLSLKAKSRFNICLKRLSQPVSLEEIAKTWDMCARAVILEYAQQSGGGNFSSKYGTWENCLSAA